MKAPLLLGNDLTKLTDETLEIITNKELIAINQDPLGVAVSAHCHVFLGLTIMSGRFNLAAGSNASVGWTTQWW